MGAGVQNGYAVRSLRGSTYSLHFVPDSAPMDYTCDLAAPDDVQFSKSALSTLKMIKQMNIEHFPICMAKTQYSLSDNPKLLGRPHDFILNINEMRINNGAEFIVAISGDIMTMPGLPKSFSAMNIDIDSQGNIVGLF